MPPTVQHDLLPEAIAAATGEVTAEASQELTEPPVHPTMERTGGRGTGLRAIVITDPMQDLTTGLTPDPITDLTIGRMRVPTTDPTAPTDGAGPTTVPTTDRMRGGMHRFHLSLSPDSLSISVSSRLTGSRWRRN